VAHHRSFSRSVIDADGHVLEDESLKAYITYPTDGYRANRNLSALFPSLDHHHNGIFAASKDAFGGGKAVGPKEWGAFCADANLRYSVLYPTLRLSMGNIQWEL
jgi:hypothetical protein